MAEEKKGFFKRLKEGLSKTRNSIVDSFSSVFGASHIDDDFYEELEETFIMADMGYETTEKVIENLKDFKNTGKTVAYFFVNADGTVVVRSSKDLSLIHISEPTRH